MATLTGTDKNIFFRAGNDTNTDMFIESATGNVGIGTTAPTHRLEVNGSVAGVGAYQDISDVRFKKNIFPLSGALNKVLRPGE